MQKYEDTDDSSHPSPDRPAEAIAYEKALDMVRVRLGAAHTSQAIGLRTPGVQDACQSIAAAVYEDLHTRKSGFVLAMSLEDFIMRSSADILGMGAIEELMEDPTVEDIAINGPDEICVSRGGKWDFVSDKNYRSPRRLQEIINSALSTSSQVKLNDTNPIIDADLPGQQRFSGVTYPITGTMASNWPVVTIRIPRARSITMNDMVKTGGFNPDAVSKENLYAVSQGQMNEYLKTETPLGVLSAAAASYLQMAVLIGLNIVVLGPTGVGKTAFLSSLVRLLPKGLRILIIEDTPEIRVHPDSSVPLNVINLRTRARVSGDLQEIDQDALVRLALRSRPDALTIGESRGSELFSLLSALNTGHKNGLTSFHAESVDRMFSRVYGMFAMSEKGRYYDQFRAAQLVASTLNIVVAMEPTHPGRRIIQVAELTGKLTGSPVEPEMQMMFELSGGRGGRLNGPLHPSVFSEQFTTAGFPSKFFAP